MAIKKKPPIKKKTVKRKVAPKKKVTTKKKVVKKKVAPKKKTTPKKKPALNKKKSVRSNRMGRPPTYQKAFGSIAKVACKLGATDEQLAEMFGVTKRTIHSWKKAHPDDFLHPIKEGKAEANENVKNALYHRACGYSHPDTKFATFEGIISDREEYTKHHPPDTAACVFWLCNRDGENWKRNGEEGGGDNTTDLAEAFMKLASVLPV